jgi:hypothetical protein
MEGIIINKSEKRFKRSTRVAAAWGGFIVSVAAAFFLATYIGDGSHEGTTGEGIEESLPVLVSFPDGVTPTNPVEVSAALENTTSETITFTSFTMDVETPSFPKCGNEWLDVVAKKAADGVDPYWNDTIHGKVRGEGIVGSPFPANKTTPIATKNNFGESVELWLEFKSGPAGTTDQSACESIPVVVDGHLE